MTDNYVDLTLARGLGTMKALGYDDDDCRLQQELTDRITGLATEHSQFVQWCDRFDALYFSTTFTEWGADLWPDDPSATTAGRSHVSVNLPPVYVDVPAALQAVKPIENMLATEDTPESRSSAQAMERIYKAWKVAEKFELKFHKATVVKGLYGRTAGFVYYDRAEERPCFSLIENPRNLWLGYRDDSYDAVEWAGNVTLQDPSNLVAQYSVGFQAKHMPDGKVMPWVVPAEYAEEAHPELTFGPAKIEVWDYWYRKPSKTRGALGKPTKMETWNVVIAGNAVVRGPFKYSEYDGDIPYVPLLNTFIPGTPFGRSDLHDVEQLIREKMTRITSGAQMIRDGAAGQYWQLVGPDAPARVSANAKPRVNEVATPGAGNRIEAITPFIAQFQLEQYLGRIDRETAAVTGLNDLLLGLAPAQVLSSSKAINALIANYESRLAMRRLLLYSWRKDLWDLAVKVWERKDKNVRQVIDAGGGVLEIIDPSLSPRDDMETATRAINLMNAKVWSQSRAMDATGVDDPEQEQNIIREERTDATLWPADVQVMAQLLAALQSIGLQAPQGAQEMAQGQMAAGQNDLRAALGAQTPDNTTGSQLGGDQGILPPGGEAPGATPAGAPFAQGPADNAPILQGMVQGGEAKGRIMTQQKLGRR